MYPPIPHRHLALPFQACNDFQNNGTCVTQCPPAMIYDPALFQIVPNPDYRLAAGDLCVEQCPGERACMFTPFSPVGREDLRWFGQTLHPERQKINIQCLASHKLYTVCQLTSLAIGVVIEAVLLLRYRMQEEWLVLKPHTFVSGYNYTNHYTSHCVHHSWEYCNGIC